MKKKHRQFTIMKSLVIFMLSMSMVSSNNIEMNGAINSTFGNSYNFYPISENLLDLNFFYNDLQGWIQYEYSNFPDIGLPINDIRKFRLEYSVNDFIIKVGDLYEIWGRGLLLNQFDDQVTNFDNGTRGMYLEYYNYPFTLTHLNGYAGIWAAPLKREPTLKNNHYITANRLQYEWNSLLFGLNQLRSVEEYDMSFGNDPKVTHNLKGAYASWSGNNMDLFVEYVDKISTEIIVEGAANDTLKRGHGFYQNINFYLGNWGLSTEYKRYAFDKSAVQLTSADYGNQIEFQQAPSLGKEHNSTLLGRVTHNYDFNNERGVQFELNGSLLGLSLSAQYAHLSKNHTWKNRTQFNFVHSALDNYLPSSDISSSPYWENYQEVSGYIFNEKLYFKLGRGENREIYELNANFATWQRDVKENAFFSYDTSFLDFDVDSLYPVIDSVGFDIYSDPYKVDFKKYKDYKSFTIPLEINYILDNGYTIGLGFQYQERKKLTRKMGNSTGFANTVDSTMIMYDPSDYSVSYDKEISSFYNDNGGVDNQYNRLVYLSISKAPKWSFTITHDWTNSWETSKPIDPYYNPLEALIYGDIKYFKNERDKTKPPSFINRRYVSAEFAYNITSSQRISIFYGSIQGGLFCSNGICRDIQPFNDGLKITYSASF